MTDTLTLLRLKQKQLEISTAQPSAARGQMAKTSGPLSAAGRIIKAGVEGFTAPFQTPVQGTSPVVQEFINQGAPGVKQVNQFLLDTVPQAAQVAGKVLSAPASALTSAAGQALVEMQDPATGRTDSNAAAQQVGTLATVALGSEAPVASMVSPGQLIKPSKNLEPGAATAARELGARGVTIPAQKLTTSMALDAASNIAETSVLGGSRMRAASKKAADTGQDLVRNFVEDFTTGASKEHVGEVLKIAVENQADAFSAVAAGAYKAVDDAFKYEINGPYQGIVDMRPTKAEAAKIQSEIQQGLPSTSSSGGVLNDILNKPDFVTFEEAQRTRSKLLGITRTSNEVIGGESTAVGKRLAGETDKAMQTAAESIGPEAVKVWRSANEFWKQGKDKFNSAIMKGIANKDPDTVYQALVKNSRPVNIRRVRDTVGQKVWKDVQSAYVDDLVSQATPAGKTEIDGTQLLAAIDKNERGGIFKEILTDKEDAARFKSLARTLQIVQSKNQSKAFSLRTNIGSAGLGSVPEAGALYLMYHTGIPDTVGKAAVQAASGAILLTPRTLSRILTSPRLSKWLIEGVGNPAGSVKGNNAIRNLMTSLVANGIVDKNQDPVANLNKVNAATAAANAQHNDQLRMQQGMVPIGP